MSNKYLAVSAATALAITLIAADASAQQAPPPPAQEAQADAPAGATESDEIVVTAERRRQNLQDVASTVKVADEKLLSRLGVNSFNDLSNVLPQLNIGNREGNVEIFIRGIGDDNNTELSEPRSAILLDGVYLPRPRGLGSFFFDLQRVELNIGPQGTLRGRNATGGSLNLISQRPIHGEFSGYVEASLGNFGQREFSAAANLPIGEKVAIRLAGYSLNHDSFFNNVGPVQDITESEAVDDFAGRISISLRPTERLSVLLVGDYLDSDGTGNGGANIFSALQAGFEVDTVPDPRGILSRGIQPVQNQEIFGARGVIDYRFNKFSLEYNGAYRNVDFIFERTPSIVNFPGVFDFINVNPDIFFDNFGRVRFDQTSQSIVQELRLFANETERFRWTTGFFYFREDQTSFFNTVADRNFVFAGVDFAIPDVDTQVLAGYGDFTFDVTEDFRFTGGVRYTSERNARVGGSAVYLFLPFAEGFALTPHRLGTDGFQFSGRNRSITDPTGVDPTTFFLDSVASFGGRDTIPAVLDGGCVEVDFTEPGDSPPCPADGRSPFTANPNISNLTRQEGSSSEQYVNWRARLEYDLTQSNLLYAGVSTGTNSSGFNDTVVVGGELLAPTFGIETVRVVEIGSKNQWRFWGDHTTTFNISGFWYDYQDQAFTVLAPAGEVAADGGVAALVSLRQNIGDSRILGLDAEFTQDLPWRLKLSSTVQILDTEFRNASQALVDTRFNFPNSPANTIPFDPTGNRLPKASTFSGSVALSQSIPTSLGTFDWIASTGFRSNYFLTIFNGDGTLPEITPENFPDLDAAGLAALQQSVFDASGSAFDRVPGYVRLDLGQGFTHKSGRWRFETYIKNVTNVTISQTALVTPGTNLRFFNAPRQFGGRIRINF